MFARTWGALGAYPTLLANVATPNSRVNAALAAEGEVTRHVALAFYFAAKGCDGSSAKTKPAGNNPVVVTKRDSNERKEV